MDAMNSWPKRLAQHRSRQSLRALEILVTADTGPSGKRSSRVEHPGTQRLVIQRLGFHAARALPVLLWMFAVPLAYSQQETIAEIENRLHQTAIGNSKINAAFTGLWGGYLGNWDSALNENDRKLVSAAIFDVSHVHAFVDEYEAACFYFYANVESGLDVGELGRARARAERADIESRAEVLEDTVSALSPAARERLQQVMRQTVYGSGPDGQSSLAARPTEQRREQEAYQDPAGTIEGFPRRCERVARMKQRLEAGEYKVYSESAFVVGENGLQTVDLPLEQARTDDSPDQ